MTSTDKGDGSGPSIAISAGRRNCTTPPPKAFDDIPGTMKYDTPVARKESAAKDTFVSTRAPDRNRRLGNESISTVIGPMPVEEFLNDFLPITPEASARMPSSSYAFDRIKTGNTKNATGTVREDVLYNTLVSLSAITQVKSKVTFNSVRSSTMRVDSHLSLSKTRQPAETAAASAP